MLSLSCNTIQCVTDLRSTFDCTSFFLSPVPQRYRLNRTSILNPGFATELSRPRNAMKSMDMYGNLRNASRLACRVLRTRTISKVSQLRQGREQGTRNKDRDTHTVSFFLPDSTETRYEQLHVKIGHGVY